jgi:ribonucleotide monophosphatase NagD (HAD superfamily)
VLVLVDLDGTVYTRSGLIDGAVEALAELRAAGHVLRFLTNTDSHPTASLLATLVERGVPVREGELFTSVTAAEALLAAALLAKPGNVQVLPVTNKAVAAELATRFPMAPGGVHTPAPAAGGAQGLPSGGAQVAADRGVHASAAGGVRVPAAGDVHVSVASTGVTHVVVGDVRSTLSYQLLDAAFRALRAGAELVALQKGRFYLDDAGAHMDTGAMVAALEFAAGVPATVVGKPSVGFLDLAVRSAGRPFPPDQICVVGDDVLSDVRMGRDAGVRTVLVRTGKYALQREMPDAPAPDHEIDSLAVLPALLRSFG